jgi:RHS repeat-associated protein
LEGVRSDATWALEYLYDEKGTVTGGIYSAEGTSAAFLVVATDRGDVRELLDADGHAFAFYSYDAYGNPNEKLSRATTKVPAALAAQIAERNVLRYAGYCYDEMSGLYYLSQRYYDPESACFISKDPARADGEESAYQYCAGDPVGSVDPSGLWSAYATHYISARDCAMYSSKRLLTMIATEFALRGVGRAASALAKGPKKLKTLISGGWKLANRGMTIQDILGFKTWWKKGDRLRLERSDFAYYRPSSHQRGPWVVRFRLRHQRKKSGAWSTIASRERNPMRLSLSQNGRQFASTAPQRLPAPVHAVVYGDLWGPGALAGAKAFR